MIIRELGREFRHRAITVTAVQGLRQAHVGGFDESFLNGFIKLTDIGIFALLGVEVREFWLGRVGIFGWIKRGNDERDALFSRREVFGQTFGLQGPEEFR